MRLGFNTGVLAALGVVASSVFGHEVKQYLGGYSASDGHARSEGGVGGTIEHGAFGQSPFTSASYGVDASVERIRVEQLDGDKYLEEHFPDGVRLQRTAALSTTHTIHKLTDVRAGASLTTDTVTAAKSWSGGIGHWWYHDSIQTNLDFSRTVTDQPPTRILDVDGQTEVLNPKVNSGGATLSLKHLATPTTIWGLAYTRVEASDRPRLDAYSAQLKQFIPTWTASVHGKITRIINTGPVDLNTTSGSMAGVQTEVAFLKTLWRGASSRAAYRFAREDEETRAYGSHNVYGADSFSLGLSQDFDKGFVDRPLTAHVVGTRYVSNSKVSATIGEAGIAMKF